ncbi:F-box protein PP2-B10-like [Ananas comosus]|uniref:F-box protein PP2-B10-like n=1 Tax=Ananas comosus TaxID=4615 RepID=A0A6P5GYN7_ANACO|nr:F-box protein PP2-B10-like [Ananas comosus]
MEGMNAGQYRSQSIWSRFERMRQRAEGKSIRTDGRGTGSSVVKIRPRDLTISQSETSQCWAWIRDPPSSDEEVAEMMDLCRLEIEGKSDCKDLTTGKTYAAYLIFKIAEESCGLTSPYPDARVALGDHEAKACAVCLDPSKGKKKHEDDVRLPRKRNDGWMEIELGEFTVNRGEEGEKVRMSLSETKVMNWKKGLIVGGIEIRPKKKAA